MKPKKIKKRLEGDDRERRQTNFRSRKQSLLQLSAKGLKDAAELVKDIAPTILTTADLIAKFIVGL